MATESKAQDLFDDLLHLEEQYYSEGYSLGVADGSRAGRIEGRTFGMEKGFEKFVEMGRMNGRAAVWHARLDGDSVSSQAGGDDTVLRSPKLRSFKGSERLQKHVLRLKDLTDAGTLPMENNEDAVSEVDDRLKDAKAKTVLISKTLGEDTNEMHVEQNASDKSTAHSKGLRTKTSEPKRSTGEMEDFDGLARVRKT